MNYFSSKFLLLLQSLEELMFAAFVIGWYLASSMDSLYSMSSGTGLCISCSPRYLVCDVLNQLLYRSRVVVHPTSCLSIPWCVGVGSVLDPSCMFLQEACFGFSSTHKEGNPLYLLTPTQSVAQPVAGWGSCTSIGAWVACLLWLSGIWAFLLLNESHLQCWYWACSCHLLWVQVDFIALFLSPLHYMILWTVPGLCFLAPAGSPWTLQIIWILCSKSWFTTMLFNHWL